MKTTIALIVLSLVPAFTHAGVYKCKGEEGRTIFSDRPCPKTAKQLEYRPSEQEIINEKRKAAAQKEKEAQLLMEAAKQERLAKEIERVHAELKRWSKAGSGSRVRNSPWDGSVSQVEDYLENYLKDPDSFEALEWGFVLTKNNQEYRVRCKYRAKNSFGGYVLAHQVFVMSANGRVLYHVDYNGKHLAFH